MIHLRRTQGQEDDSQTISSILIANQDHLELLRLEYFYNAKRYLRFLPPNLKFLSVRNYGDDEVLFELAAKQCPRLRGVEYYDPFFPETFNAISRFEKFVAYLTIWIRYIQNHYLFQSHISWDSFGFALWRSAQCSVSFWKPPPSPGSASQAHKKFQGFIIICFPFKPIFPGL